MYIMYASAMRIRQPTLTLKPRGNAIRNPKQGYQWPQNRTHVSAKKTIKKTKTNIQGGNLKFDCLPHTAVAPDRLWVCVIN